MIKTTTTRIYLLIIPLMIFFFASCKKKAKSTVSSTSTATFDNSIVYPASMTYGNNMLATETNTVADGSFGAKLGKDANLKIVLTNLTVHTNTNIPKPVWFYDKSQGWTVSNYDNTNDTQSFTSNKTGEVILEILFNGPGSCKVEYYENSATVTKTKVLSW